jgi:WD40 repeat protein
MQHEVQSSAPAQPVPTTAGDVDAFISYKRADLVFADQLCKDLESRGKKVWLDRTDIGPAEEWQGRIRRGIEAAKAFIFVVTPDSVVSSECLRELSDAGAHHKRIVPVIREDTSREAIPRAIGDLNWIFARTEEEYRSALNEITDALEADLPWRDRHVRLAVRSREWIESARDRSYLLRGHDLRAAEDWFADRDRHREQPTNAQSQYIIDSRRGASRRQRITLIAVSGALALSLALAGFSLVQRNDAVNEGHRAVEQSRIAESDYLASEATSLFSTDAPVAMQLSIEAYRSAPTSRARNALLEAAQQPLEATLRSPDGRAIESVAFDPDGQTLASGDQGGDVVLWSAKTLSPIRTLRAGAGVNSVTYSPDGSLLAAGLANGDIVFWRSTSGAKLSIVVVGSEADGLTFSPDGAMLAASTPDAVVTYDVHTGHLSMLLVPSHTPVWAVAFSVDGKDLVASDDDGNIIRWSTTTRKITASMRDVAAPIHSLAFSPDGTLLGSADASGYVILWNVSSNTQADVFSQLSAAADVVAYSPDDQSIATGTGDGDVDVISVVTGLVTNHYPFARGGSVTALAYSPDGQVLAAATRGGDLTLWGAFSGDLATSLLVPSGLQVGGLAFDSTGAVLASGDGGGQVVLWDSPTGKRIVTLNGSGILGVAALAFRGTGEALAVADRNGVTLWDTTSQMRTATLAASDVVSIAFSPDGGTLAIGEQYGQMLLWNLTSNTYTSPYRIPGDFRPEALAYNPDGQLLAIGDGVGDVLLWNTSTNAVGVTLHVPDGSGIHALAYSRDGGMLASADGGGQVVLWNTHSDMRTASLSVPDDRVINSVSLSPDGRTLATGDVGGEVILWSLTTDAIAAQLAQPDGQAVEEVAFSPDGRTLASADANGVIFERMKSFWNSSFQTLTAEICLRVGASLSRAQWSALVPNLAYSMVCPSHPPSGA